MEKQNKLKPLSCKNNTEVTPDVNEFKFHKPEK